MKKFTLFFCLSILFPICVFSQYKKYPAMKVLEGDTIILFHIKQAQELIKINENKNECIEQLALSQKQLDENTKIVELQQKQIQNHALITRNQDTIINRLNKNISLQEEKTIIIEKEMKRQKRHKIVAVIGLFCVSILGIIF